MRFDENDAVLTRVPVSKRWQLFREMIQEPDDNRRAELARRYYDLVNRDLLATDREIRNDSKGRGGRPAES
jgi:hypothetical protein